MFKPLAVFSGFSVDDLDKARRFYVETLGFKLKSDHMGLELELPEGGHIFVYPKSDHQPAGYTMLNLVVTDIDQAVTQLAEAGVEFLHYEGMYQDDKNIARGKKAGMGPDIAWFKDPAGNILSVLEDDK